MLPVNSASIGKSLVMNIQKHFKVECVVDWIDLEFYTISATPAWRLSKTGSRAFSFVTGLDPKTGEDIKIKGAQGRNTPTTRFTGRIQNPTRLTALIDGLSTERRIDPTTEILVSGFEVSFDLYALEGGDGDDLAVMAGILASSINRVSSSLPRAYRCRGETHFPIMQRDLVAALKDGYMVGFGNRDDDLYQRTYFKTTDDNMPLPKAERRARIEIRLQGEACPVRTLEDLREFDFARLAKFFKFRQADTEASDLMATLLERRSSNGGILDERGQLVDVHRYKGRKRKTVPLTSASPLNGIARNKLRNLTARWRAEAGRGKVKKPSSCEAKDGELSGGLAHFALTQERRYSNHRQSPEALVSIGFPAHVNVQQVNSLQA